MSEESPPEYLSCHIFSWLEQEDVWGRGDLRQIAKKMGGVIPVTSSAI